MNSVTIKNPNWNNGIHEPVTADQAEDTGPQPDSVADADALAHVLATLSGKVAKAKGNEFDAKEGCPDVYET